MKEKLQASTFTESARVALAAAFLIDHRGLSTFRTQVAKLLADRVY